VTKHEIINEISYDAEYIGIARKITGGHDIHKDLFQEFIILLYGFEDEKIIGLYEKKELRYFSVGVMRRMLMPNHEFFKSHKILDNLDLTNLEIKEDVYEVSDLKAPDIIGDILKTPVKTLIKQGHFGFEKAILKLSVDLGSAIAVSKKTGIDKEVVYKAIRRIKKDLKNNYGQI